MAESGGRLETRGLPPFYYQCGAPKPSSSSLSISTAPLTSTKSSSSSLTVFNFSFTLATPSNPTICLAGGFSCPPIAVKACNVSAMSDDFMAGGNAGYKLTIFGEVSLGSAGVPLSVDELFRLPSRRSSSPPRISRDRGAGLLSGEYWGSGGADVILLVRTLISRFGWTIVILMLKGAISYARLCKLISTESEA